MSRRALFSRHLHSDPGSPCLGLSRRGGERQDRLPLAAAHLGYRAAGLDSLSRPARPRGEALTCPPMLGLDRQIQAQKGFRICANLSGLYELRLRILDVK